MNTEEALMVFSRHAQGNFPGDESRSKLSQRAKTVEKIALHLKTTYPRRSVP